MIAPVLLLALAFFAGVATATGFDSSAVKIGALTIVALGCAPALLRGGPRGGQQGGRRGPAMAVGVLLLFALGLLRASDGLPDLGNVAEIAGGRRVELTGVIVADPVVRGGGASSRCGSRRSPSRWGARAPPSMARCCSTPPSGRPTTTGIGFAGRCGSAISRPARPPNSATYFKSEASRRPAPHKI